MKTTRTLRILLLLLSLAIILPVMAACNKGSDTDPYDTGEQTNATTKKDISGYFTPPEITITPNASVYSGTPDTSWYQAGKTEFILTSADQFAGFLELRSETVNFEGITVKLGCDMVFNQGSAEEIKAKGSANRQLRKIPSTMPFKGTFDGQGHTLSGIYMQLTDSAVSGLFGSIGGNAAFKNFNLVNSYFGGPTAEGKETMAALVSVVEKDAKVRFEHIHIQAILEETDKKLNKVGAYIGGIYETAELAMSNCTFEGSVTITGKYAGGFIGRIEAPQSIIRIGSCTNYGDVKAASYCGGMIGQMKSQDANVSDCVNRGNLTCSGYKGSLIGEKVVLNDPFEGARPDAPEGTTALRVMSFNVQTSLAYTNGVLQDSAKNRIEAIRQEILYHTPDFLGLQEDNLNWLMNLDLSEQYNLLQFSQGLSSGNERCAIYYRKGLKLLDSGMAWLTSSGEGSGCALTMTDLTTPTSRYYMTDEELAKIFINPSAGDKSIYEKKYKYTSAKTGEVVSYDAGYSMMSTRRMTWGVFDINGQTVIYINTHLNHRSQNAEYSNETYLKIRSFERVKEFAYLQETLAEIQAKYPNSPVFMTGDWNDNPFSEIYNVITKEAGFKSAHLSTDEVYGVTGSWNNAFDLSKQGDCYPSSKEGTAANYLDYCFVSPEIDVLRFVNGEGKAKITTTDGKEKYIYTSDHRPIITDICFVTPKTGSPLNPDSVDPSEDLTKPSYYTGIPNTAWYTGDKTEYTLTTADQFMGMMLLRQNSLGTLTFQGVTIKLARDLIFNVGTVEEYLKEGNKVEMQSIHSNYPFKGTFDGQGHTINGAYLKCTTSGVKGIFGGLGDNAVIKNLILENCYLGGPTAANKKTLGILAARISGKNVLISNVKATGVLAEDSIAFNQIGGLIGRVDATGSVTLENCEINGRMEFGTYGTKCGGLIGTVLTGGKATITNCKVTMDITCQDYAGGMVGYASNLNDIHIDAQSSYTGTITCAGANQNTQIGNK